MTGYFENNAIKEMVVMPNAEAIYYSKDDAGAYLGVVQAQSERMRVYFENEQVSRILLEQEPRQTMTPMQQVNIPATRLSRFQWLIDKRPKSVQELFDYDPYPAREGSQVKEEKVKETPASQKTKSRRKKKR